MKGKCEEIKKFEKEGDLEMTYRFIDLGFEDKKTKGVERHYGILVYKSEKLWQDGKNV